MQEKHVIDQHGAALALNRVLKTIAAMGADYSAPHPRKGEIAFHDSSLRIWEDSVEEPVFKREVFEPLIRLLRRRGWKVGVDASVHQHYRCLSKYTRYCRLGGLEAQLELRGRTIEFGTYQNIANVDNRNGGRYDFDKLARMPYAMRLRALAELRAVTNHLILRHGYRTKLPKPTFAELGRDGITVDRLLAALYADSWHTDKTKGHPVPDTYNVTSADRQTLQHGDTVWIQDRQGRWLRGTAFYNINNMWYVAIGKYELHNMAAFRIHVSKPASLRRQPNLKARRARLEEEFRKAVAGMDFDRAKLLQKFLFGEQDVFRIWARQKDAWYRQQAQGYTSDSLEAGLYTKEEATAQVADSRDLKIVPAFVGRGPDQNPRQAA